MRFDKIEFIEISDILRCEGEGNYTHIFLVNGEEILASKTLKEFDELLTEKVKLEGELADLKTNIETLEFEVKELEENLQSTKGKLSKIENEL